MYFSNELVNWYRLNKRELPWRSTTDPYIIWLSEIILQQTRVNQGLSYFYKFAEYYPTVRDFASAPEDEILRNWQGLGYYSRARNMLRAAKIIVQEHAGIFPSAYKLLIELPGIGEYTASAISSFAANEARAVVDGNVYRVLARYYGIDTAINSPKGKKEFQLLAQEVLSKENPGLHNQAIMEFGALHCKPQKPLCTTCPLQADCYALKHNLISVLPVKLKSAASRSRFFNYFLLRDHETIAMQKRGAGDIWENLYELPLWESSEALSPTEIMHREEFRALFGESATITQTGSPVKHILSHQIIYAHFFEVQNPSPRHLKNKTWNYVLIKDLDKLAKSKLIYSFIDKYLFKPL